MEKSLSRLMADAEIALKGRWFNWRPGRGRRDYRKNVRAQALGRYFKTFLPEISRLEERTVECNGADKIFSLWLQGEQNAPPIVKACARSVRRNCTQEFLMLDEKTIGDYMELPGAIVDKFRSGKMGPAHFSDLVRVELLYNHGGVWLDATCLVTRPIPELFMKPDFFAYLAGGINAYSFMQNAFIRARKGAWLLDAWRTMMHRYWTENSSAIIYLMHQIMFKTLVENDPRAIERFADMPHIEQDPTHALWWNYGREPFDAALFDEITSGACWQKTAYKDTFAKNPPAGSFADEIINRMYT